MEKIYYYYYYYYSTVTEEGGGVRGWLTPYSTLCGVSVTGATSLVAECGTKILLKKHPKILFLNPFFMFEVNVKNVRREGKKGRGPARVWGSDWPPDYGSGLC